MHKAHIAEVILALFTSRERAASTVGDLMENTPARGGVWFWLCVLRTAFSLLWSDFAAEPAYLAGLAFRGILVNLAFLAIFFLGIIVFGLLLAGLFAIAVPSVQAAMPRLNWALSVAAAIAILGVQFQTGRWIGGHSHHREIAASIVYLMLQAIIMLTVLGILVGNGHWSGVILAQYPAGAKIPDMTRTQIVLTNLTPLALLWGAIWVRRQRYLRSGNANT